MSRRTPKSTRTDTLFPNPTLFPSAAAGLGAGLVHIFPTSIIDAMAKNEILQIVVFAIFAGVGLTAIGGKGAAVVELAESAAALMLRITDYVMRAAPLAVFAALAAVITVNGLDIDRKSVV